MVSKKTVGGLLAGSAVAFAGILYMTIQSLSARGEVLGCMLDTPGCAAVATGMSVSHFAVGFLSALFSLGLFFLFFYKDNTEQLLEHERTRRSREEQVELLSKVMTPGEQALLSAVLKEEGILQSTLTYRTNLTPGRVSQVLAQFEERGLVRRTPEGRSFRVYPGF